MIFENPYRLFFPLGWLLGIAGVALWPLVFAGAIPFYPKEMHADTMMGGFLILFISGFLMTALPRFTGTSGLDGKELACFLASVIALLATLFLQSRVPFHLSLLLNLIFLMSFSLRRVRIRTILPPPPLIFVLFGLMGGIVSMVAHLSFDLTGQPEIARGMAQLYFYQGFHLCLVLGVGIFLIPNLFGHPACTPPVAIGIRTPGSKNLPYLKSIPKRLWIVIAVFFLSFYLQAFISVRAGEAIRAIIFALVSFHDWRIHRLPPVRSALSIGLWLSCWILLSGLWLQVVSPGYDIHARHLTYIGGFGLMTLMIATRVTLAHGGLDMTLEKRSRRLKWVIGLIIFATLTRVTARLLPETFYLNHLAYAAWIWIAGLFLWGSLALPRMIRTA